MCLRYWQLSLNSEQGDATLSVPQLEELEDLLADATRIRLRSDVPVGIFLSGGIDSGLVAALAGRESGTARPLALTVGYEDALHDESCLAAEVARHAGLSHRVIQLQPAKLDLLDRLAWHFDEPFGDSSALPTFSLCEEAAKHATVFLGGDGGDEAFGGYRRYIKAAQHAWVRRMPTLIKQSLRAVNSILPMHSSLRYRLLKVSLPDSGYAAAFDGMPDDPILKEIFSPELVERIPQSGQTLWSNWAKTRGQSLLARQQALDYALYLPGDILVKVDRASMAHSIEVRSPFLDHRVVTWAARLPRNALLRARQGKQPLRALARKLLPPSVAVGRKRGFGVPIEVWFRSSGGQHFLRERLLSPESLRRRWWKRDGVDAMIVRHASGCGRDFSNCFGD